VGDSLEEIAGTDLKISLTLLISGVGGIGLEKIATAGLT
jgi:hypothetical protein